MITREKAKEMLVELGVSEPTEEQITSYLNAINSEVLKEKEKADKYKADAQKKAELEAELERIKNEGLTADELRQKELEAANNRIAELEKGNIAAEVKAIFGSAGLAEEDYKEFLDGFTGFDVEAAKTKAKSLISVIENTKIATEKKVKEELLDGTKGGGAGGSGGKEKTIAEKTAGVYAETKTNASKESQSVFAQYGIGGNE